jgi:hypothetical protein
VLHFVQLAPQRDLHDIGSLFDFGDGKAERPGAVKRPGR